MTARELLARLDRFFFQAVSPVPLSLVRIFAGLLLLETIVVHLLPDWSIYYSREAIVGEQAVMTYWWQFDPVIDFIPLLPGGDETRMAFFTLFAVSALCVTAGLFTRFMLPISFLMLLSVERQFPHNLNGGDVMLHLVIFLLCFGRSGDALSFDNLLRAFREDWRITGFAPVHSPAWVQRILQLQLSLAYIDTFLWKISGQSWLDGTAVYWATRMHDYVKFQLPFFLDNALVMRFLTWSTLIVEFSLGTLIWFKEFRYWVLLAGLLLHLGIDITLNLPVFEMVFITLYLTFVDPDDLARFWTGVKEAIARKKGPPRRLTFDGDCVLCVRATGVLHRLDVFGRIRIIDFRKSEELENLCGLDSQRLEKEMLLEDKGGWTGGFRAFRSMLSALPLLWFLIPVANLPGMAFIGDRLYGVVARNRYVLFGRCSDASCSLHAAGSFSKDPPVPPERDEPITALDNANPAEIKHDEGSVL